MVVENKTWIRDAVVAATAVVVAGVAFLYQRPVPFLDLFDLGVHEAGHLVAAPLPRLAMFLAGSIAQVALPVAMAWYFGLGGARRGRRSISSRLATSRELIPGRTYPRTPLHRGDRAAAGLCLVWAGTSARDVSIYAGDAVTRSLPLIGGEHDWAYILGPRGFDALEHTATIAASIEWFGAALAVGGIAVAAWSVHLRWSRAAAVSIVAPAFEAVGQAPRDPWRVGAAGDRR